MARKAGTIRTENALLVAAVLVLAAGVSTAQAAPEGADKGTRDDAARLRWSADAGLGYDSNVYRTHDGTYVDQFPATPVTVTPEVRSGFFVPLGLHADYRSGSAVGTHLRAEGRFNGHFYSGSSVSNADDYTAMMHAGLDHVFSRKKSRQNELYVGVLAGRRKQVYVDRDTGDEKSTAAGLDISNRYTYSTTGLEGEYRNELGPVQWGFNGQFESRDYDDPVVVDQYDHKYWLAGAEVEFSLGRPSHLKLAYEHATRDYDERNARDANGAYLNSNPVLRYTYGTLKATLRNRFGEEWVLYLDLARTTRADNNVGYADYAERGYGARLIYDPEGLWRVRTAAAWWSRDYDKAFAYDNPTQPRLSADGIDASVKVEYGKKQGIAYWGEAMHQVWNTNDLRYDYNRTQLMVGVSWKN